MATSNLHTANHPGPAGHQTGPIQIPDNPYTVFDQLQQHSRFNEYYRQIRACLFVNDHVWSLFSRLRADPDAADFLEDLHLGIIHLVPPTEIWHLLVSLRMQPSWPSVRNIILSQMNHSRHQSYSTASTRSSAASYRSLGHLSSASTRSHSNATSGYSYFDTVQEGEEDESVRSHPTRSDTVRTAVPITGSGRPSRKAPMGQRFICPHGQCRGKYAFKRAGDFDNHIMKYHQGEPDLNPYDHLKEDLHVLTQTPIKSESADNSATVPPDSPSSTYNAFDDFQPTGPEYHLPIQQMMPEPDYFRNTGVSILPGGRIPSNSQASMSGQQGRSFFNHEDEMDDK